MLQSDVDRRRSRVDRDRARELDRPVLVFQRQLDVVRAVGNDLARLVPAVPGELVKALAEEARPDGVR